MKSDKLFCGSMVIAGSWFLSESTQQVKWYSASEMVAEKIHGRCRFVGVIMIAVGFFNEKSARSVIQVIFKRNFEWWFSFLSTPSLLYVDGCR